MPEQVEQQKALHLESDIGVDHNAQSVEDSGSWRFEIAVFDDEPVLDDTGRHALPHVDHVAARQLPNQTSADQFMARERAHPRHITRLSLDLSCRAVASIRATGLRATGFRLRATDLAAANSVATANPDCAESAKKPPELIGLAGSPLAQATSLVMAPDPLP